MNQVVDIKKDDRNKNTQSKKGKRQRRAMPYLNLKNENEITNQIHIRNKKNKK